MNPTRKRAMLLSLLLIFSTLAGCLDASNETSSEEENGDSLGTVMVSTYHIGELVKAVAGDRVDLQYMSLDNIPVHDYEPTANDLIRLEQADIFFYHGLGLEPWVDSTLSLLTNAPTSIEVHAMPDGQDTLDYEGMLVTDLCETLSNGPYEAFEMVDESSHADDVEVHAEYTAFNMSFPHDDHDEDSHDDHDEDEHADDDHDEHGDDDHDDHGAHEGHAHAEAEETITNPEGCPADTIISIFHLEEGEYVLEFDAVHPEDFTMAVLKMGGGHAHHDHAHADEHGVCHDMSDHTNNDIDNEEECEAGGFMWMEEDDHDDHDGDYCHDAASHTNTNHTTEEACVAAGHMWMEADDHDDHHDEDDHELTPEHALEEMDSNNDSHLSWDEFWMAWENDHDDHDEHGDHNESEGNETHHNESEGNSTHDEHDDHDEHDEHEEEMLMEIFNESDTNSDGLLNVSELEHFIEEVEEYENAPLTPEEALEQHDSNNDSHISWDEFWVAWTEDNHDDHDDSHGDASGMVCYNTATHSVDSGYTNQADCEAAGLMWTAATGGPGGDDSHDEHDDHDEHTEEILMEMFNESDMNSDGLLNMTELEHFIEDVDAWSNPEMAYVTIHIDAEGEYGFALPDHIEYHVLMGEDGHDHSEHSEDTHDDHDGEEDDEHADEDGDEHDDHGDEEMLNFDPHSWLNPLAFNAQLNVVLDGLSTQFPSGNDTFGVNAAAYSVQLTALDDAFDVAFGDDGLCMAGGHKKTVAANHNAYSYIAVEYDIQFVTVHGLDPEGEPSPADIAKVVDFINEEDIGVLFVEENTDTDSVQSIVDETGVAIKILYTMELAPSDSDDTYMSMMTKNLENIVAGIGC
ncbi:MAG: zinc ABC transporter substrate-binding protein [Candidatus Poseidoniaceae archaeon]|nr:zinc ABC transporter substrate-binding protein [Candidatus Poseidoniaceae archaeon]